jgi:hypothetical protein
MTAPITEPDVFRDGPAGDTPLDAQAMNRIWAALMQALLDQLVARPVGADNSANMRDMLLVDASNGPVTITAPQAIALGQWGARKVDGSSNPVTIVSTGADVLDEHNRTSWTLVSQDDDVIFSFASPGHFVLWRASSTALPASPTRWGPIKIGGDLTGEPDAIRVPSKENVGVAQAKLDAHTVANDPHGDRAAAASNAAAQILAHSQAVDPHGDRSWGQQTFVPLSWFDANGQLLSSHTPQISVISTNPVANQAEQLALTAQPGDIAIRTDTGKTYILQGQDPTQFSNWTEMPAIGKVSSVNGQQGTVTLGSADVGAAPLTHAARHAVGGPDDLSGSYVALASMGTASGPAAYNDSRITGAQQASQKNVANGYAGLDANNRVAWARSAKLVPVTTIATAARTPADGELVQYNAGAGSFTQALPAAPTGATVIKFAVKNLTPVASPNTVTFTPAGTDTIDGSTDPLVLRTFGEVRELVGYQGKWTVDGGLNTLAGLDARYVQIANARMVPAGGAAGYALVKNTPTDFDYGWAMVGTATSTQADLRIVSVRSYGAVGDGTTDDTAKIQQALANTPVGGLCYVPPGNYGISAPIVRPPGVTLQGSHADTLWYTGATAISCSLKVLPGFVGAAAVRVLGKTAGGYTTTPVGGRMRDLMIDGTTAPANVKGVQLFGFVREETLDRVTARKMTDHGFDFARDAAAGAEQSTTPQSVRLYGCVADNCSGAGFSFTNVPDSTLVDCNAQGSGWIGFYLAGMPNGILMGCRAEWAGQHGFYITSGEWGNGKGSGGLQMFGCITDRNNYDGLRVDATGSASILVNGHQARRDGRNNGNGGGVYAGVQVVGSTMPVLLDGLLVSPGVNDDAASTVTGNSPQFGVRVQNSTYVALGGASYVWAATTPISDAGGNGQFHRAPIGTATGPTDNPVRVAPTASLVPNPPVNLAFAATLTPNAADGNYRTTTATADFALLPPTNPTDGQLWRHRWVAQGAQRTMTLGAGWRKPATVATTLTVPSGRRGDLLAVYEAADGAWTILTMTAQQAATT